MNPFYYQINGYTPKSVQKPGFSNIKFILPETVFDAVHSQVMEHVNKKDTLFELEYQGLHKSGTPLWLLARCTFDPQHPQSITCILVGIAEHKQLESWLRLSIKESRLASQLMEKLMYVFDIPERTLFLPNHTAKEFDLSQVIHNVPDSIINCDVPSCIS